MLFSKSTEKGLIMTTKSMKEIVNVCLNAGANFIMTRRLNQDPLESYFGHQRQRGHYSDSPTVLMFAHNVRFINCFLSNVTGTNVQIDETHA